MDELDYKDAARFYMQAIENRHDSKPGREALAEQLKVEFGPNAFDDSRDASNQPAPLLREHVKDQLREELTKEIKTIPDHPAVKQTLLELLDRVGVPTDTRAKVALKLQNVS